MILDKLWENLKTVVLEFSQTYNEFPESSKFLGLVIHIWFQEKKSW